METTSDVTAVHYLPILTTIISAAFAAVVLQRYQRRGGGNHLLWWAGGILVYGAGTFAEGWITLFGWSPTIFKFWYIVGALLGGAPLAQGTVWLLLRPATARRLTAALVVVVAVAAACVIASPINYEAIDPHLPSGNALGWQWVRLFSPFINTYAVIFLVGGAILSAWRFHKASRDGGSPIARDRFVGNVFIAAGAILPGFGGMASRAGHTEILYIMELVGIMLIWVGFWFNVRKRSLAASRSVAANASRAALLMLALGGALLAPLPAAAQAAQEARHTTVTARGSGSIPALRRAGQATQEARHTVTVRVFAPDGSTLGRAVVTARAARSRTSLRRVTEARGEVQLADLRAGRYTLEIRRDGFATARSAFDLPRPDGGALEFTLEFAAVSERVTVAATRTARDVDTTPGEVSVVPRERFEQWQARSLDDVLRFEPGVDLAESARRLGQTINIRGFDDERVLVVRDGARVSQYASGHRGNLFFDVEDISSVEVLRGPASALYGSGALGGVVSIRTLDPGELLAPERAIGAQIRGSYSSAYGEWMTTPRAFGQTASGFGWLVGYTARQNDGTVRLANRGTRLSDAEENVDDFNARFVAPLGAHDFVRVSLNAYDNDGVVSANLSDLEVDAAGRVDRSTRQFTFTGTYERAGSRWFDGGLHATAYYNDNQIDENRLSDERRDRIGYRSWGLDARNSFAVRGMHNITYGVEVVRDRQQATRNEAHHEFFPDGSQNLFGVYAQDEVSLLDGRLTLVPGLRWDRWSSASPNEDIAGQEVAGFTPRLGASFELGAGLVATGNYAEGFRAPRFRELFLSGVHFAFPLPGNRFFLAVFEANSELLPEESRNIEGGLRFRRGAVAARFAYWRADVRNFIELLPVLTSRFPPPGGTQVQVWRADNVTDATLSGAEAGVTWEISPGLLARGTYSRGSGSNRATDEPLLNTPGSKLVLGIDWSRADAGTRLGLAARAYSARDDVPEFAEPTDGYLLLDATFSWTPTRASWLTGHLGVNNLADTEYSSALFGAPGTGRDIRGGITLNLR